MFYEETEADEAPEPIHIRIPFLQSQTGLGSVIAAATSAVGMKPCAPCEQRKEALNRRLVLDPWRT